jgi:hypothetical protein
MGTLMTVSRTTPLFLSILLATTLLAGCGSDDTDCPTCMMPTQGDTGNVDPMTDGGEPNPMMDAGMADAAPACEDPADCPDDFVYPDETQAEGGTILSLAVSDEHDHPLEQYQVHHPIRVKLSFRADVADHHDQILVGLVEKHEPGDDHMELTTCRLGEFAVDYYQRDLDNDGENDDFTIEQDFIVPDDCLPEGSDEKVFNIWVSENPAKDNHPSAMELGGVAPGDYNTQFFNAEAIDTDGRDRNASCIGPDGEPGCIIDIKVVGTSGDDLKIKQIRYESSVFTVSNDCETQLIDHGQPHFEVFSTLRMHGAASYDGETPNAEPLNVLQNDAHVEYSICPRATSSTDVGCLDGHDYRRLSVTGHDAMAAGEDRADNHPINELFADTPHIKIHDLHVDPNTALCDAINGGDWNDYHLYNLRACVVHDGDESGPCDSNNPHCDEERHSENNCKKVAVALVRVSPEAGNANSYNADYAWSKSGGNSVVGASAGFETVNRLDLSGATTHNLAHLSITGWAPFDVFRIWLDAQAYVSVVGSGVDAGLTILNENRWSYSQSIEDVEFEEGPSYDKSACLHYNYGIAGIGLNVDLCANANAGIAINGSISGEDGENVDFPGSSRVGSITASVTPSGTIGFTASASINIAIARGGLTGTLNIIEVELPAVANLQFGLVDSTDDTCNSAICIKTVANASVDLTVNFLSGSINVWVDLTRPNWCGCGSWCPGYPCFTWASVVNQTLLSFTAYSLEQNLYNQSASLTLE